MRLIRLRGISKACSCCKGMKLKHGAHLINGFRFYVCGERGCRVENYSSPIRLWKWFWTLSTLVMKEWATTLAFVKVWTGGCKEWSYSEYLPCKWRQSSAVFKTWETKPIELARVIQSHWGFVGASLLVVNWFVEWHLPCVSTYIQQAWGTRRTNGKLCQPLFGFLFLLSICVSFSEISCS